MLASLEKEMHLIGGPGKFALTMEHSLASEASEKH